MKAVKHAHINSVMLLLIRIKSSSVTNANISQKLKTINKNDSLGAASARSK